MSNKPFPPFQTTPGGGLDGRVAGGTLNNDTSRPFEKPKNGRLRLELSGRFCVVEFPSPDQTDSAEKPPISI
jgi:hypothetical protein